MLELRVVLGAELARLEALVAGEGAGVAVPDLPQPQRLLAPVLEGQLGAAHLVAVVAREVVVVAAVGGAELDLGDVVAPADRLEHLRACRRRRTCRPVHLLHPAWIRPPISLARARGAPCHWCGSCVRARRAGSGTSRSPRGPWAANPGGARRAPRPPPWRARRTPRGGRRLGGGGHARASWKRRGRRVGGAPLVSVGQNGRSASAPPRQRAARRIDLDSRVAPSSAIQSAIAKTMTKVVPYWFV